MRQEDRTHVKINLTRMLFVILSLALQCFWFVTLASTAEQYAPWVSAVYQFLPVIIVLLIYSRRTNAQFKMPWMILITAFPLLGVCLFLLFGRHHGTRRIRRIFRQLDHETAGLLRQDASVLRSLRDEDEGLANESRYLRICGGFPLCREEDSRYYSDSADAFRDQLEEIRSAKRFIFLEYHCIEDGSSFARMLELLKTKAEEGLDVRILYDDLGSMLFINRKFIRKITESGIRCRRFNPVLPFLNVFMGNRDHHKIMVVDGRVAFTGGYNLADEYFHVTCPYGEWKDTGIRFTGAAVDSVTLTFLKMWNAVRRTDSDPGRYLRAVRAADSACSPFPVPQAAGMPGISDTKSASSRGAPQSGTGHNGSLSPELRSDPAAQAGGYIQPYSDSPLDHIHIGEDVYMNIIRNARRYVWFSTPYLVLTDEMICELTGAARRGVDVRILTPGRPDKRIVYSATRSYYAELLRAGVRIYEFTPGFNHAKLCVSDDSAAVIGTINLDYRSLFLHFENAVLLMKSHIVHEVRDDLASLFPVSRRISGAYPERRGPVIRIWQCLLRLIAPML